MSTPAGNAVAERPASVPMERPIVHTIVRPVVNPPDMIAAQEELAQLIKQALKEGTDYGVIPGTKENALFKAGAERLIKAYGCFAEYPEIIADIDHDRVVNWTKRQKVWNNKFKGDKTFEWKEVVGVSHGLYSYRVRCRIVRASDGQVIGEGWGSCSTMESKYIDRPRDCENTVLKMSQKRSMVGAALNAFALSDRFTQDMEDETGEGQDSHTPAEPVEASTTEKARVYGAARTALQIHTGEEMKAFVEKTLGQAFIGEKDVDTLLKAIETERVRRADEKRTAGTAEKAGETYDADESDGGAK